MRLWMVTAILWVLAVASAVLATMPMPFAIVVNRQHKAAKLPVVHIEFIKPKIVARVAQIEPPEFSLPGRYEIPVTIKQRIDSPHRFRRNLVEESRSELQRVHFRRRYHRH